MQIKHALTTTPAVLTALALAISSTSVLAADYNAKLSLDVPEGNTKYVAAQQFADLVRERADNNVPESVMPASTLSLSPSASIF